MKKKDFINKIMNDKAFINMNYVWAIVLSYSHIF